MPPDLAAGGSSPWLLQRLRLTLLRNTLHMLVHRSPLRLLTIFLCSAIIWGALFTASYLGFRELDAKYNFPLNGRIIGLAFDLMFVSLTIMLIISTEIILYSSLFTVPESTFLLSTPTPADRIFAYKFQGAVAFSSWGFLLLGSPILIGYGLVVQGGAPWYFYAALPLFFLGFVLVPGSLGALLCLLLVNYVPRRRKQVVMSMALLIIGLAMGWGYQNLRAVTPGMVISRDWVNQLLSGLAVFHTPVDPAHWIARGLQAAALGEIEEMAYNLALVWSNGLFLYLLCIWAARKLYRRGFNRAASGGNLRRRYGGSWLDDALARLLFFLDPQTHLLIVKDFRTFRRDPVQWAQILIFLGLAVLYFSNVRRFYEQDIGRPFQNGISLLNLTATAFLMCAYTGRFIFPMLSLEGRKFWILGLLPLRRERLLWGKFAFATIGSLLVAEFMVIFSNLMLYVPWPIVAVHALTIAVLSFGLSGLSVGLGTCLANFRETDPSKIAVGFGGTLNLVAGLLLLLLVIGVMAVPWHLLLAAQLDGSLHLTLGHWWLGIGLVLGLALGTLAAVLPLRMAARALKSMEF